MLVGIKNKISKQGFLNLYALFRGTIDKWLREKAPRLAAALSFYTILSLAPLLLFFVAVIGFVYSGRADTQAEIIEQANALLGEPGAEVIQSILSNATDRRNSGIATIISLVTLLFSASNVFNQIQDTMDTMWNIPPEKNKGIIRMLWRRFKAFGMVFGMGLIFLLTLLLSVIVQTAKSLITELVPFISENFFGTEEQWESIINTALPRIDLGVSFLVLSILFAWMFKAIPHNSRILWRDVWHGAMLTALLFIGGKYLLAWYIAGGSVGSAYGAAGSLLVLLIWFYYTMQILLLGVSFTYEYAHRYGSHRYKEQSMETSALQQTN